MPSLRKRRCLLFVCAAVVCSPLVEAVDLPVRRIVIYKNGVALVERSGTFPAGEQPSLEFRSSDMNDILKSLTIFDSSGHQVNSIRYDSHESLPDRLRDFPFSLASGELLSQFLDSLKGSRLEVKTVERTLSGSILGARAIQSVAADKRSLHQEQLTLLTGTGDLITVDLAAVASLRFEDPHLQDQLKRYLQTLNDSRSQEKRRLFLDATGSGPQDLKVAYVIPVPIWKSSYRLTLDPANPTLEGWAIVDNTTDEDWQSINLSVVSGRPVSFISELDQPRYGKRSVAELPDDAAAAPVLYGGSVGKERDAPVNQPAGAAVPPPPSPGIMRNEVVVNQAKALRTSTDARSTIQAAAGAPVGELFEYSFPQPVTILRSQSALIPFVQAKVGARKLLIFNNSGDNGNSEYPVNAAEITNSTSKTLDGGPLTVFDGGAYAGEALVETVKAGDKRLIGYAVDFGTRITTAFDSGEEQVREIHAGQGVLKLRYASRRTQTYSIENVDSKPKTLVIQQQQIPDYQLLSPEPTERTADAYRFELPLAASRSRVFKVESEHVYVDETEVTNATPDFLLTLVDNRQLSSAARKQLAELIEAKRRVVETTTSLQAIQAQIAELTADQARMRQNIDSLNRVSGQEQQVQHYAAQLGTNEAQLALLREKQRILARQKDDGETAVRQAIEKLKF